jgi:hypothetical protein
MAINFVQGQVAVGDPSPTGPTATSNDKDVHVKVVKLTSANFTTGGTNTMVAVLPADSTILGMKLWVKAQLAGGSISAATYSVGSASAGTQFVNAITAFGTAGAYTQVTPISGIVQNYGLPLGADISLWVNGTATTGNPTSGELYLIVEYVR